LTSVPTPVSIPGVRHWGVSESEESLAQDSILQTADLKPLSVCQLGHVCATRHDVDLDDLLDVVLPWMSRRTSDKLPLPGGSVHTVDVSRS
jgi:hypothetical protein